MHEHMHETKAFFCFPSTVQFVENVMMGAQSIFFLLEERLLLFK